MVSFWYFDRVAAIVTHRFENEQLERTYSCKLRIGICFYWFDFEPG